MPTMSVPPATALYARISDDRHDGAGVDRQVADCRALCARRGWALGAEHEYVDNDISASRYARKPRARYAALLEAVRAGEVSRIVCYLVDRLYRQPRELEDLIDLAEAGRVEVVPASGGDGQQQLDLTTTNGRTMARVAVAFAAGESDNTSTRVRRQQRQARERGVAHGGSRPFGWLAVTRERNGGPWETWDPMQHDALEAQAIRDAVAAIVSGASLAEIGRRWDTAGLRRPRGKGPWTVELVKSVLTAPRNAGLIGHKGEVIGPASWPAIIDPALWEQCRSTIAHRYRAQRPGKRSLLTGLVRCDACGWSMQRHGELWGCVRRPGGRQGVDTGCNGVWITATRLEAVVTEAAMLAVDTGHLASSVAALRDNGDVARIHAALVALDQREADATASYAGGRIPLRAYELLLADVEHQRADFRRLLARQEGSNAVAPYVGEEGALRSRWESLSLAQRRAVISAAIGRVTIAPSTGRGRWEPERIALGIPATTSPAVQITAATAPGA